MPIKKRYKGIHTNVYGGLKTLPKDSVRVLKVPDPNGSIKKVKMLKCMADGCSFEHRRSTNMVVHVRKHFEMKTYNCNKCK